MSDAVKPAVGEVATAPIINSTSSTSATSPSVAAAAPRSQESLARKQFPAVVFLLQHRSGGLDSSDTLSTLGVYMSLSNANAECRRLKREAIPPPVDEAPDEASKRLDEERRKDIKRELERWSDAEGVECWVEVHAVIPRKFVIGRGSVSSVTHPTKLYQNEEDDDEIVEEDDYDGYHC